MPEWAAFAGVTGVVVCLLVVLAHLSKQVIEEPSASPTPAPAGDSASNAPPPQSFSSGELLANVALTQGLLGSLLVVGAWYTQIPLSAFGLAPVFDSSLFAFGVTFGVALYAANELAAAAADSVGFEHSDELRELLAPSSAGGWLLLLGVVLPVIALFEEFLFRAALIGALTAGFGVSPWLLAVLSTVLFALGHGMQGPGGIVVTGVLGFVLAAAFVLTGSFLVVAVAHYLVNAFEFIVHEGLGVEWT